MVTCINLRERFGKRYRVTHDPAYVGEYGEHGRTEDPWLQLIVGRAGHVFPWGGDTLAASTNCSGRIVNKLLALEGAHLMQDGTDGATVAFPVERFAAVARLLRLRTRRQLTPEQKAKAVATLAAYSFAPGSTQLTARAAV